jgi:uncharacterized protein (TIGR02145 family)
MVTHVKVCIGINLLLTFFISTVSSQVTITQGTDIGLTPQQFVETYLVGSGITISNALFNGSNQPLNSPDRNPPKYRDQIGSFVSNGGAQTELGIGGGVILSTGYTEKAKAGNNPSDNMWGNNQPAESDPDLVILAGGAAINDKSVLEFDFIPQTDIVSFRYVFGSIEFDGFCGSINDAFGLFLSGPGIAGGLGFVNDAVNIALLPNSTNYVNIFNICEADQGNLGQGIYSWWNSKKDYYSYNRLTYVFTASYTVQCNQTYHMKFAIGDASDGILDSGVFLEQNSFTSNNITGTTTFSNPLTGQLLVEGCNNVSLNYSIPQTQSTNLVINLSIHASGTATGADITPNPFPAQITIPAGQLTATVPIVISAIADGLPEGTENLVIKASTTNTCGVSNEVSTEFIIRDFSVMNVTLDNQVVCNGTPATLTPIVTGGQPVVPSNEYIYLWSNNLTTSTITVSPPAGIHTYTVTVTDACGQSLVKQATVSVGTIPGTAGPISGNNAICTPVTGEVYSIPAITGADSYTWTIPAGGIITSGTNTSAITVNFDQTVLPGNITVKGHSNVCGDGPAASLAVSINPAAPPAGTITGPGTLCQGFAVHSYSITPLNYVYAYEWTLPQGVSIVSGAGTNQIQCTFGTTAVSGSISVRGLNSICGPGPSSTIPVTVNPLPEDAGNINGSSGTQICVPSVGNLFQVPVISYATSYEWQYSGSNVQITNNGPQASLDFAANATSGQLVVTGINGCGQGNASPSLPLTLKPSPVASIPTPLQIINTTKNGRPILLRGGAPAGAGGIYSGTGVSEIAPNQFVFDPSSANVDPGGTVNGAPYTLSYTYTNVYGCSSSVSFIVKVFASNASNSCPGQVTDVRDNQVYSTFISGAGSNLRCWLAENLNVGTMVDYPVDQSDNFIPEKNCINNLESRCNNDGGFYQWNELMHYSATGGFQDLCPPGFHVPTASEWQILINESLGNGLAGSTLKDMNRVNGFHGLLPGFIYQNLAWFFGNGNLAGTLFWSSTPVGEGKATARGFNSLNNSISEYPASINNAFSVRCVRN